MSAKSKQNVNKGTRRSAEFERLCAMIDDTDFKTNPYRGILRRLHAKLGYKTRAGLYHAIHVYRKPEAVLAVVKEIRRIDAKFQEAACNS